MTPPIDPDKDFAGFVEERLLWTAEAAFSGMQQVEAVILEAYMGKVEDSPESINEYEDLASHFARAASEIRAIAKAIRRKHGMKKRRAEG